MSDNKEHDSGAAAIAVAQINARQVIIVTVITAMSGTAGAVIQGMINSRQVSALKADLEGSSEKIDSLKSELDGPGISVVERKALYQLTADVVESDVRITGAKREAVAVSDLSDEELQFRRIRRAVFLRMGDLRANSSIVGNTLDVVASRGHDWVSRQKPRVMADLPAMKASKLRWIEDLAIPALQRAIEEIRLRPMRQDIPSAKVPLPRDVWILRHESGEEPTITVTDMQALLNEAVLIKQGL